jgi:hypothetical protein
MALSNFSVSSHTSRLYYRGKLRRLVLRPFGFGVFYAIEGERLMVGALLDLRQAPDAIERRLER